MVTNLTEANADHFRRISAFSQPAISVSIDATGDLYSYMRGGAAFDFAHIEQQVEHLLQSHPRIMLSINITYQIFNAFNVSSFLEWFSQLHARHRSSVHAAGGTLSFNVQVLSFPREYAVAHLPEELKEKARADLIRARGFAMDDVVRNGIKRCETALAVPRDEMLWDRFIQKTRALDKIRGTDITKVLPEISSFFKIKEAP